MPIEEPSVSRHHRQREKKGRGPVTPKRVLIGVAVILVLLAAYGLGTRPTTATIKVSGNSTGEGMAYRIDYSNHNNSYTDYSTVHADQRDTYTLPISRKPSDRDYAKATVTRWSDTPKDAAGRAPEPLPNIYVQLLDPKGNVLDEKDMSGMVNYSLGTTGAEAYAKDFKG